MPGYFVTGTDTDVGKTRVTAALARALALAGDAPTIVKLVQTGLRAEEAGDAALAGSLAGVAYVELARYRKPADPWAAALAEGREPPRAEDLALALARLSGRVVAEGSGGVAVPLNARESIADVATAAGLAAVVAVGLRLGCINHALLTLEHCRRIGLPVAGAVLVERWGVAERDYRDDVARALQDKTRLLGILPFANDAADSVESGARLFAPLTLSTIEDP